MPRINGTARVDRRTKNLIPRLKPGQVAIIDHRDLDALSASGLVERRPSAVVNVSPSISGRYPNRGPSILLRAGIPLVDVQDEALMNVVGDGQSIVLDDDGLHVDGRVFPARWLTSDEVETELERARGNLGVEIEAFARNTLEYIERERHLVVDNLEMPDLRTLIQGRHAVIVVRGDGFKRDLQAILPYINDVKPVLIAVDGGADALLEEDLKPDLIVGDMDSVSDRALRCGAEIVVHSYPVGGKATARPPSSNGTGAANGQSGETDATEEAETVPPMAIHPMNEVNPAIESAPGLARLKLLGIEGKLFSVAGTSEDMAMLIAYEKGAELIVALGTHFGLVDFLDKGRAGMASTFLVRLRVASRLVDARGVGALYQTRKGIGSAWGALVVSALVPVAAIAALSPGIQAYFSLWSILFTHWLHRHGL